MHEYRLSAHHQLAGAQVACTLELITTLKTILSLHYAVTQK